eukprot:1030180-Prymnesium_polylepis.4
MRRKARSCTTTRSSAARSPRLYTGSGAASSRTASRRSTAGCAASWLRASASERRAPREELLEGGDT